MSQYLWWFIFLSNICKIYENTTHCAVYLPIQGGLSQSIEILQSSPHSLGMLSIKEETLSIIYCTKAGCKYLLDDRLKSHLCRDKFHICTCYQHKIISLVKSLWSRGIVSGSTELACRITPRGPASYDGLDTFTANLGGKRPSLFDCDNHAVEDVWQQKRDFSVLMELD